ncbi:hypothetical protein [Aeromonas caviae]
MFDIEDSKDVTLKNNTTAEKKLARVKNVEGFNAEGNKTGFLEKNDDLIEMKPAFMGISINLKELYRRAKRWLLRKPE